jgi:hypothetical protein
LSVFSETNNEIVRCISLYEDGIFLLYALNITRGATDNSGVFVYLQTVSLVSKHSLKVIGIGCIMLHLPGSNTGHMDRTVSCLEEYCYLTSCRFVIYCRMVG